MHRFCPQQVKTVNHAVVAPFQQLQGGRSRPLHFRRQEPFDNAGMRAPNGALATPVKALISGGLASVSVRNLRRPHRRWQLDRRTLLASKPLCNALAYQLTHAVLFIDVSVAPIIPLFNAAPRANRTALIMRFSSGIITLSEVSQISGKRCVGNLS